MLNGGDRADEDEGSDVSGAEERGRLQDTAHRRKE